MKKDKDNEAEQDKDQGEEETVPVTTYELWGRR